MGSMKDALMKIGLEPTKKQNDRPKAPKGPKKKIHDHQVHRNFCDHCNATYPDVELYRHRNPTVTARWMCVVCADKNEIPDSTRETNQSDFARRGTFSRGYGATKHAREFKGIPKESDNDRRDQRDNRSKNFKKGGGPKRDGGPNKRFSNRNKR